LGSNPFSTLVKECGDTPQPFFKPKSDLEAMLFQWAELTRSLGKLPTQADWICHDCKPTTEGISRSHKLKWADLPYKFMEDYSSKDEWSDVIDLIPKRLNTEINKSKSDLLIERLTYEYLKFIPPVVQDLVDLSINEEKSIEFEKKVNLIFRMLGFDVTPYGQGKGRNPDGIATENQHRYAILIDSKCRRGNYRIGTEDRKFIEYIKTHSESLKKDGFPNIYFLVVSSAFDGVSTTSIKNIKIETQVTTTLLPAWLLLKLLSIKIQNPRPFDLKKFQELLIVDGEITESKIDKFIKGLK
jgi:Restriction endonuclease FokI, C terminal